MISLRSKLLPRRSLLAALVVASVAVAPSFANPQMPSATGPWSSEDYVQAIFAVQNGLVTLPREANPKTKALFDRLIDPGNIDALMAAPLSEAEKRRDILIMLSTTGEFRGRYGYAVALGDDVQSELVAIQIFRLNLIDRLASLHIAEEKTGCMVETDGENRCLSAIATIVSGTIDTLGEKQIFKNDQLVALSVALTRHLPAIRARLGVDERLRTAKRLQQMAASESDPALKSALSATLTAVRGHD